MGKMGSEISKDVANVILVDDNFATIVNGIQQGRLVFDNLRKVVAYLFPAGSFSEVIPVLMNVFFGIPLSLSAFQMIVICVATDVCGALSLVHEKSEVNIMERKPRNTKRQHLVDLKVIFQTYLYIGVIESLIAYFVFFYSMWEKGCNLPDLIGAFDYGVGNGTINQNSNETYCNRDVQGQIEILNYGQSAFFVSLVVTQLWNLINSKTRYVSIFKAHFRSNLMLFMWGEIFIVVIVIYIPFFNKYLNTVPVDWEPFVIPLILGSIILILEETRKLIIRLFPKSIIAKLAW